MTQQQPGKLPRRQLGHGVVDFFFFLGGEEVDSGDGWRDGWGNCEGMDVLAPGAAGSGWVLKQFPVTLMHGHELYYALAAAYYQIHLNSHWVIY